MFNEVCITIITGHELFFTDLMPTRSGQFNVGWSMIMLMVFNTIVNFSFVLKMVLWNTYLVFLKYYWLLRRCCDKDFMRELPEDVNPEIEEAKSNQINPEIEEAKSNQILDPIVIKDDIKELETKKEESKKNNGGKSDRKKSDRKSDRKQVKFEDDIQKTPKTKLDNKKDKKFEDGIQKTPKTKLDNKKDKKAKAGNEVQFKDIDFQKSSYPDHYDPINGINIPGDPNHLIGRDYFKKYNDEAD